MKKIVLDLYSALSLEEKRKVVGVRFIKSEEEYLKEELPEMTHTLLYCMMVKIAASGKAFKVCGKHFYCGSAARTLGILEREMQIEDIEDSFYCDMYASKEIACAVYDDEPFINEKNYGVVLQPLETCKKEPDIIIVLSSPYNVMRIVQGYTRQYGYGKQFRMAGMGGLCAELTARPYITKDINVSVLCSNTRYSCRWKDEEMGVSMPYEVFCQCVQGVIKTLNATEPDDKKEQIIQRVEKSGCSFEVKSGKNYYDSCLGVGGPLNKHDAR